jgi:hypothetical protein
MRAMRIPKLGVVCALIAVLAAGACGDDESPQAAKLPKTGSPEQTLSAITDPPLTPAFTQTPPTALTPDDAARTLHDHWVAGDSTAALETATQKAVNELFAHPGGALDFQGCIRKGSKHTCFFYYEGGGLNMIVRGSRAEGYLVSKAFFVAD